MRDTSKHIAIERQHDDLQLHSVDIDPLINCRMASGLGSKSEFSNCAEKQKSKSPLLMARLHIAWQLSS